MSSAVEATGSTYIASKAREVSFEGSESTRSSVIGRCESPATVDLASELDWALPERVATACLEVPDQEDDVAKGHKMGVTRDALTLHLDQILGLSPDTAVRADKHDGYEQSGYHHHQQPMDQCQPFPQRSPQATFALHLDMHLDLPKSPGADFSGDNSHSNIANNNSSSSSIHPNKTGLPFGGSGGGGGDVTPTRREAGTAKEQLQEMMGSLMRKLGSDRLNAVLATTTTSTTATSSPTTAVATPMVPTLSPLTQGEPSLASPTLVQPFATIENFPIDAFLGHVANEEEGEFEDECEAILKGLDNFRMACGLPEKLPDEECYMTITVMPRIAEALGDQTAEEEREVKAFGPLPVKVMLPWYPMVYAGPRDCTMPLKVEQAP